VKAIDFYGLESAHSSSVSHTFGVDTEAPTIVSVSSTTANGTYGLGKTANVTVTFSEAVTSTGNVTITLETGTTDREVTCTVSNATTCSGTYTVQASDISGDLTAKTVAGTIADQSSNAMTDFTIPTGYNIADLKAIIIDTVAPTLTSATIPSAGNVIDLLFSKVVYHTTETGWAITMSGGASTITYSYGSGSTTLRYALSRTIGVAETGKYD
jgi:hypothetical protein